MQYPRTWWLMMAMVVGLRKTDSLVEFFERIVNAVHEELPEAKFAFNNNIEKTREAVDRIWAAEQKHRSAVDIEL